MALVTVCSRMHSRDLAYPVQNIVRVCRRGFFYDCNSMSEGPIPFSSLSNSMSRRWRALVSDLGIHLSSSLRSNPRVQRLRTVFCASQSGGNEKQLKSLESYFEKLQGDVSKQFVASSDKTVELLDTGQFNSKKGLESLDAYFGKLNKDVKAEDNISSSSGIRSNLITPQSTASSQRKLQKNQKGLLGPSINLESASEKSKQQYDETSDLYLISFLASINIAVFLFEMASPTRNSELELFSLPLLYGAKINDLILVGQWWRLVTPMFLHSGLCHIALSCWALLTFGREVCRGYGSFTFFLIYILGGISGNLTSFLHTPEPTVGGTGPVFALIGAWLIYQIQNRDVIAKDVSDSLFQKAMVATAISFILSHFGPIDDWTHVGAAFTGIAYGFFTSPALQVDDGSSRKRQDDGITLVKRYANPCKSLFIFAIFVLTLSSLLVFIEPPLNMLASINF